MSFRSENVTIFLRQGQVWIYHRNRSKFAVRTVPGTAELPELLSLNRTGKSLSDSPAGQKDDMVKKVLAILFSVLLFLTISTFAAEDGGITEHILQNGLKILILEKHAAPVVAVQVWYRVGSHNDGDGVRGIAHLFEHMMFRGSENYGSEEHFRLIDEVGGNANAETDFDRTVYYERLPAQELELALKLEAERMHLLTLTEETFNTEREVVKEEYRLWCENNPHVEILMKAQRILYPDHPYSWPILGTMSDLERISVEDCRNFYQRFYAPNNAVLVIVGSSWGRF